MADYKAWFEKYRPITINDLVFPNKEIQKTLTEFYDQEFIRGNILAYGPPGHGKTSLNEILIHKIIKDPNDIFILGRKTEDVDNLKRWLLQRPVRSNQKIVKIEEMDRLSYQAQIVLKDGLMEKFQANTSFLATTNTPEKIDPALLTRFNVKINFINLPPDLIYPRLAYILQQENIQFDPEDLRKFIEKYHSRGLRDLINNLELASRDGHLNSNILDSFVGTTGNEDLIIQYIIYLVKFADSLTSEEIQKIIKNVNNNEQFATYYNYMLSIFKSDMQLNFHYIYQELFNSDLDLSSKNIIEKYWQDLDLKRFKHTHTVALIHELLINILKNRNISVLE